MPESSPTKPVDTDDSVQILQALSAARLGAFLKLVELGGSISCARGTEVLAVSLGELQSVLAGLKAFGLDLGMESELIWPAGVHLLSAERIRGCADELGSSVADIEVLPLIGSTNAYVQAAMVSPGRGSLAVLAEAQFAGRGRRGKVWQSPFGANLYLSFGWRFSEGVAAVAGLSLAVGVAVAELLSSEFGIEVDLKWPNDVLYQSKKLAGILIETSLSADGSCAAVVGMGLNVGMTNSAATQIDQPWIDLATVTGSAIDRDALAGKIIFSLEQLLSSYAAEGFQHWRERWRVRDAFRGRNIVITGAQTLTGEAAGVDEQGALLVATESGIVRIYGGEVSVRRLPDE